jgi:hypothetical protein
MNHNLGKLAVALMGGLGLWTMAIPAQATAVTWSFFESAQISATPVQGTTSNALGSYSSATGVLNNSNDSTSTLNSVPTVPTPGLSSVALMLQSEGTTANVAGSLSSGATHISSATSEGSSDTPETTSIIQIEMEDTLTFSATGVVTMGYVLDGNLSAQGSDASYNQAIEYFIGTADMDWTGQTGAPGLSPATASTSGFNSFLYTNDTISGFTFTGTFSVTAGESLNLFYSQTMNCSVGENCDFGDTGQMSLTGVPFTSNSGVFLTQQGGSAVPEPGSLLLVGLGLGTTAIGCVRRRRFSR